MLSLEFFVRFLQNRAKGSLRLLEGPLLMDLDLILGGQVVGLAITPWPPRFYSSVKIVQDGNNLVGKYGRIELNTVTF